MKTNRAASETDDRARFQLIENRKESVLALCVTLSLSHDLKDGKGLESEREGSGDTRPALVFEPLWRLQPSLPESAHI